MNKKFYGTLLLGTLLLGSTIVSCKDYDDDIDNLQNQITQLATKADMQSEVSKLQSAVATAQAAAENKAAAAEKAAKDAEATAKAAAEAAAKAQGTADAAATVEALNKVAADAAAAAKAAEDAKVAAEAKAAELEAALAELKAFAETLVSTTDFEAAKKELNEKFAALQESVQGGMGTLGLTGLSLVSTNNQTGDITVGYGVWKGVHEGAKAATWKGPKKAAVEALENGTYVSAFGTPSVEFSVNPVDFDVTNTQFAVVNKYGEIAPIAFGTPKAVTRGAGFYTMDIAAGELDGDVVKEFEANFKNANNQDGSFAALVAGNIAAEFKSGFVKVTPNRNDDQSSFDVEIPYDKINGTWELAPQAGQKVYDSYIVRTSDGDRWKQNTMGAHDSLYYNVKYVNNTITYNAENVKKAVNAASAAGTTFTLNFYVSQINLNGYVHNGIATVTFKAKPAPDAVEMEPVDMATFEHKASLRVWNEAAGAIVDKQYITISEAEIQKAIGLTDKKSDAYIHYNHANRTYEFGKPTYTLYNDDMDATVVTLEKFFRGGDDDAPTQENTTVIDKKKFVNGNYNLQFAVDYPLAYDASTAADDKKDYVQSEMLVTIPLTITVDDQTDGEAITKYHVNIPVQFRRISVEGMYKWVNTKVKITTAGSAQAFNIEDMFECVAKNAHNAQYFAKSNLVFSKGTKLNKDNGTPTADNPIHHIRPAVTVSGQLNSAYYKKLAELQETGYVDTDDKFNQESALLKAYMNSVYVKEASSGNPYAKYDYWIGSNNIVKWGWKLMDGTVTETSTFGSVGRFIYDPKSGADAVSLANNTYTVSGVYLNIGNGRFAALSDIEVELYTAPAAATPTITATGELNASGESYFYNSATPAGTPDNFDGSFTLKNANGKTLVLVSGALNNPTAVTVTKADGTPVPAYSTVTGEGATIKVQRQNYTDNTDDAGTAYGLKFTITGALESGETYKLTFTVDKTDVAGLPPTNADEPQEDVTLTITVK